MRIAVNLLPFRQQLVGAGRYAKNIVANLAEIDTDDQYYLFVTRESSPHFQVAKRNFTQVVCPFWPKSPVRILWEQFVLPWQLVYYDITLLFTPSVAIPYWLPCRAVTAIHDVIPFHQAVVKYPRVRSFYVRLVTAWSARRSEVVLTGSENSRCEIISFCKVAGEKIVVIPYGVEEKFRRLDSMEAIEAFRSKYGLPERFILFVGALEPGKNLVRLLEAFLRLRCQSTRIQHKLVLAGPWGWGSTGILRSIDDLELERDVIVTGFVAEEELPLLYNSADLFAFPSLYEGFGLPLLEAMACGTPVIASNTSSLPEVVGEAGMLVNPYDVEGWTLAMKRVLSDENLQAKMISTGMDRAKLFSWKRTAQATLAIFEKVGNAH